MSPKTPQPPQQNSGRRTISTTGDRPARNAGNAPLRLGGGGGWGGGATGPQAVPSQYRWPPPPAGSGYQPVCGCGGGWSPVVMGRNYARHLRTYTVLRSPEHGLAGGPVPRLSAILPGCRPAMSCGSKECRENAYCKRMALKTALDLRRSGCPRQDSNLRPSAPEADALSPELRGRIDNVSAPWGLNKHRQTNASLRPLGHRNGFGA